MLTDHWYQTFALSYCKTPAATPSAFKLNTTVPIFPRMIHQWSRTISQTNNKINTVCDTNPFNILIRSLFYLNICFKLRSKEHNVWFKVSKLEILSATVYFSFQYSKQIQHFLWQLRYDKGKIRKIQNQYSIYLSAFHMPQLSTVHIINHSYCSRLIVFL